MIANRLRDAWRALRGYAAAQDARASTWAASGGSANSEVASASSTITRRAHDAVRNDPYAARIIDLWTGNAVGAGITTRWPDKKHADAWRHWAESTACDAEGRLDLYGLQALVMRSVVESGECLVRLLVSEPTPINPIGLRLQVLESDHLDASRTGTIGGAITVQGITLDATGAPAAYWLFPQHPGANWYLPGSNQSRTPVPAAEVLHIYRKRRPGQLPEHAAQPHQVGVSDVLGSGEGIGGRGGGRPRPVWHYAMPGSRAAVPPRIAARCASVRSGVAITRSTSVLVQGNG